MQINQENVDQLNAIIRIDIKPEDYQPGVEKQLKEYGRKASMPGFRPGKIPSGMIKKMYGRSVLLDELNKLTSESLYNFIREKELNILGNPLPLADNDNAFDPEQPGEMQLSFEIGLAPEFQPDLSNNHSFNLYLLAPDDTQIDNIVNDYRNRFGSKEQVEEAAKGDSLHGVLEQLDDAGNVLEDGIHVHADISEDVLVSPETFLLFTGLKKGSEITIKPKEVLKDAAAISSILRISPEEAVGLDSSFRFTVEEVNRVVPVEINQDFFDKLFGEGKVEDEAGMRKKISEDIRSRYKKDAETRLFNEVVDHLVNNTRIDLPDSFMKKWLVSNSEGRILPEDIDVNYENYAKGIRWQLIEGKILKDNQIAITQEDVVNKLTEDFLSYMGMPDTDDEDMRARAKQIAQSMLKNEKEVNRVYDQLYNEAMTALFLRSFDVKEVELSFDRWLEQINAPLS